MTAHKNRGFSMLEVLIAVLIFSFGLLGLGMLQGLSVKSTQSSSFRSQAITLAYQIIDSMRANRNAVINGQYYSAFASVTCSAADPTGTSTSKRDLAVWQNNIACQLPEGQGQVHFPGSGQVEVTIQWTDSRWALNSLDRSSKFILTTTM